MLVANETVAQHLDDNDVPTLYRIHEEPDPLKVEEFEEFVTTLGYSLGAPPNAVQPRHFQKLVEKIHGKPEEKPIAFLMLRTMQKARYDRRTMGHFGLAAEQLHALHVADPPLSRTSSSIARCASRGTAG